MPAWNNYYLANSPLDALQALAAAPGTARLVAGGTDLLLDLQQGRHPPVDTLVDITAVPELRSLEIRQDCLFIGAGLPLNQVVASQVVRQHAPALIDACGLIGGPQVRNTATLGGNVAHALPAADGAIALIALGAQAEILDQQGYRRVPVLDLFLGPGQSALHPTQQLLVGFYLPLSTIGQASAHRRVMRPQGVAIAILNMAAWIQRKGEIVEDIRLALGPAGPKPLRALAAEDVLRGHPPDQAALANALNALLNEARFRTSPHRATAEYRRHLAGVLLQDVIAMAWKRTF